jgi:bifunctional non-homologous end joining protein LigD
VETALDLRALMKRAGFETWPKLTGGKGIHLMAPVDRPVLHDKAHRVAHQLVSALAARHPDRYLLSAHIPREPERDFRSQRP